MNVVITEAEDGINLTLSTLKLQTSLSTSNMVLFNEKNHIKKYSVDEIINDFCILRFSLYEKRRLKMLEVLSGNMRHISNKVRFILEIIEAKFDIMNVPEQEIIKKLVDDGYDRESDDEGSKGYEYLLRLNVRNFTAEKVENLKKDLTLIEGSIKEIEGTDAKKMWLNDLGDFENEYSKWLKTINKV